MAAAGTSYMVSTGIHKNVKTFDCLGGVTSWHYTASGRGSGDPCSEIAQTSLSRGTHSCSLWGPVRLKDGDPSMVYS